LSGSPGRGNERKEGIHRVFFVVHGVGVGGVKRELALKNTRRILTDDRKDMKVVSPHSKVEGEKPAVLSVGKDEEESRGKGALRGLGRGRTMFQQFRDRG